MRPFPSQPADLIMGCLARFRPVCAWAPTILAWGHADISLSCVTFLIRRCISVSFAEIRPGWLDVEYSKLYSFWTLWLHETYNNLIMEGRMCLYIYICIRWSLVAILISCHCTIKRQSKKDYFPPWNVRNECLKHTLNNLCVVPAMSVKDTHCFENS